MENQSSEAKRWEMSPSAGLKVTDGQNRRRLSFLAAGLGGLGVLDDEETRREGLNAELNSGSILGIGGSRSHTYEIWSYHTMTVTL